MDGFKDAVSNITKATGDFIKSAKISVSLSNEEANLKSVYVSIGKKVHEIYAYGGSLGEFFDDKYKEILELECKIADLKTKLDIAKGTKTCGFCGKICPKNSEFCLKCGAKMNVVAAIPLIEAKPLDIIIEDEAVQNTVQHEEIADVKTTIKCNVCGYENFDAEKFCLSCGRML